MVEPSGPLQPQLTKHFLSLAFKTIYPKLFLGIILMALSTVVPTVVAVQH